MTVVACEILGKDTSQLGLCVSEASKQEELYLLVIAVHDQDPNCK